MTTERRGPHVNHLNQLNHLNHLKPLYSPPAQQTQMTLTEHLGNYETPNCSRLMCSVCQRDFKSLPALNGHMRSHRGLRGQPDRSQTYRTKEGVIPGSPVPIVMPVSVPVRLPASPFPCLEEEHQEGEDEGRRGWKERKKEKRRDPHRHSALVLPRQSTRGAVVFQSVLRSIVQLTEYTPPPMLRPDRDGTGLYCSLTTSDGDMLMSGEHLMKNKPRINVGIGFQADVPPLQDQRHSNSDIHKALVLWTPWDGLENSSTQHRVECLLMMSCSSVCPGGGTNSEYALHSLSESRGDFLGTLEKMLLQHWPMTANSLSSYHYAGSDTWSPVEKRLVKKAFMMYQKDFHRIQKTVGTKSVSQCVEYYYTWKRRLRLNVKTPVGLASTLPEVYPSQPTMNGKMGLHTISTQNACQPIHSGSSCPRLQVGSACCSPALGEVERPSKAHFYGPVCLRMSPSLFSSSPRPSNSAPSAKLHTQPTPPYPCRACAKVFSKVKSRNAHMKTHRHEDTSP
uniref:transcriptional-regulating factor 1-like isoform X2 n=1 Tax=Oncorhynchus gorbuscha TaxID=8017 RepID=UPI001EAEB007|nr:transcriptional-regulating factor 1-like isoform X2 [Oncorhynchus gorbuscha]